MLAGKCKLCLKSGELVDSHVIPAALHQDVQRELESKEPMRLVTERLPYEPRSPTGVYGQFLCRACKSSFHPFDEEGIRYIRLYREEENRNRPYGTGELAFETFTDYRKFKLWILSLVWRAHHCNHHFYHRIDLGLQESRIRNLIRESNPGDSRTYSVAASVFNEPLARWWIGDPHPEQYDGINHIRFYIYGGFTFIIKIDLADSPEAIAPVILDENGVLPVIRRRISPSEKRAIANAFGIPSTDT